MQLKTMVVPRPQLNVRKKAAAYDGNGHLVVQPGLTPDAVGSLLQMNPRWGGGQLFVHFGHKR